MIDALVTDAPDWSDDDLEDAFCARFGATMVQYDDDAIEDTVNPDDFVQALLSAIDQRLHQTDAAVLQRLLTVVARVLPFPLSESARGLVGEHLRTDGARGRALTGPVLWTHDAYGCRWAVVAPFSSADGPDRWYLWDVDACGYDVVTVDSGFHPSADDALDAWREAVGHAAAGAALTPAHDPETLDDLLPSDLEETRLGGENQAQYAEFLRCRRLGQTAREATNLGGRGTSVRLTADEAKERFAERLRRLGYHDRPAGDGPDEGPAGADELATEMANFWSPQFHPTLYPACSPHKVALTVLFLRDFFKGDYAAELVAVLPEWIRFLAEQNGTASDLTERCLEYASGDLQFPGILDAQGQSNAMARVAE